MKRMLLSLGFLFLWIVLYSQSPGETIKYLKNFYSTIRYEGVRDISIQYDNILINENKVSGYFSVKECVLYSQSDGCVEYRNITIKCSEISAICLYYQPYKLIEETESKKVTNAEAWVFEVYCNDKQKVKLFLDSNNEIYSVRFKNALLKLAEYSGAKVVKEDMFD